jgi:transposase
VTVFAITANGTREALQDFVTRVKGILVSDRAAQFTFWAMNQRQICWAHLARRFVEFAQRDGETGRIGESLVLLTPALFHQIHRVRDGTMKKSELKEFVVNLAPHVEGLLERAVALKHPGVSKACANILSHREALWTFVHVRGVEATNNHAERELRRFVLWRRRSFGSQSEQGDRYAERIMTVAHSLRKQQRGPLEFLIATFAAQIGRTPAPSLLPVAA